MHNKLECDTFAFNNTMLEQYSEGGWFKEDLVKETLETGIMFPPNSNLIYTEFIEQQISNEKYCIALIDAEGLMYSWQNVTHIEAANLIEEKLPLVYDGKESFLTIFNMKDGMNFQKYEEKVIDEEMKKFYSQGRTTLEVTKEMLKWYGSKDMVDILIKHDPNVPPRSDKARKWANHIVKTAGKEIKKSRLLKVKGQSL